MDSPPFHSAQSDVFALQPLLEGLARLHEWVAISDQDGRALWTSDGQLANDVLAGRSLGPSLSEVLPIRENEVRKATLRDPLTRIHRELAKGSEASTRTLNIGPSQATGSPDLRLRIFRASVSPGRALMASVVDPAPPTSTGNDRRTVEALEAKSTALENDLHNMAHSLRSSLVPLLGFSRLLKDDYAETVGEEGALFIHRVEEAGSALSQKLDEALQIFQIREDSGERTLVDPRKILIQIQSQQKLEFEEARVKLAFASELPLVYCIPNQLHELMLQLLMNAAQHMGDCEDRRIEVSVSNLENEHILEVRDHGQGVPHEELEKIFEIFRSNAPSDPKRAVQGLGLAVVRKIALAHGGRAWAENATDQGARFRVALPFAE